MAITLAWDAKVEIGHERIDSEHRIFLSLIRDLSIQAEAGATRERIEQTLREVFKYADFHFTSEENIMSDVAYPDLAAHRQLHTMLLTKLKEVTHDFRASRLSLEEIVEFLFRWFALHTTQEDRRIAEHLTPRRH